MNGLLQRNLAHHLKAGRWRLLLLLLPLVLLVSGSLFLLARPAPRTTTCRPQGIATQHGTLAAGYRLEVRLDGTYDHGAFCGRMSAQAHLSTPAHGPSGTLFVFLTNCRDTDLLTKSVPVPAGGAAGQQHTVSTALLPLGCGYASAQFLDSHQTQISLAVHTNAINASGSPIWEQWRG